MEPLTKLFHDRGKNAYVEDFTPSDPATWPLEWKTTFYKEYKRFPTTKLPEPEIKPITLQDAILTRKSSRDFSNEPLSHKQLSPLLKFSCGEFKTNTENATGGYRAQPSGGGRFPIEAYLLLFKSEDMSPGVYHYNVKQHALEFMWDGGEAFANRKLLTKDPWTHNASGLFVMTGVFWRNQNKYGARGYRMICIEAGAVIQNVYLLAQSLNLKCVAYSGTNDDTIEQLLDLDTEVESLIMSMLIGT